ncbi:MAG: hypothetical protein JWQ35_2570 [Bacteriovoracaceae bacterium]|nr:hypothetical protein [Bacteriovoracaceae bacterium]
MDLQVGPWNLVVRAVVVYLAVLLLLRLGGKRQLGQMSPTEFVAILLISNAVQNAMNAGDNSLVGGLILAAVLVFLSWSVSELSYRSRKFSSIFEGVPSLLIRHGQIIQANLKKERLTLAELRALLRKQGIHDLTEIHSAILESDGTLSIIRQEDLKNPSTIPKID